MKDELVERVAEGIWQAEWVRAGNGGLRKVPWTEVASVDQDRYRFVARAVLAIARPAILEEAAQVAYRHGQNIDWDDGDGGQFGHGFEAACEEVSEAIRALAITGQEGGR